MPLRAVVSPPHAAECSARTDVAAARSTRETPVPNETRSSRRLAPTEPTFVPRHNLAVGSPARPLLAPHTSAAATNDRPCGRSRPCNQLLSLPGAPRSLSQLLLGMPC